MKFTLRLEQELPPVLRGLTFDGQKGLFIHRTEGKKVDLTLPAARVGDSVEEKAGAWKALLDAYTEARRLYPAVIGFEGLELQYGLGTNYDEAVRAEGVSALPVLPPSTSRADVVRDKIALVTGGAQGFGEGMVRSLVEHGAFVFIADMNAEGAQKLADELNYEACITVAKSIPVNVTDELSVMQMMDEVASQTGSLDLFISNAGVLRAGSVKSMALKDFQFVTNVDYTGFFICSKFASQQLALQNAASHAYYTDIIAISSKSGLEGSNKNGAYAGAKFGTIGLTQSFALELVEDNIKVNAVCPGNFLDGPLWSDPEKGLFVQYLAAGKVPGAKTIADVRRFYEAKVPMNRGCRTEDVMKAILYIVEQTYETGQAVPVTGGQVMLN
ncbi:MAG: SDR family NAD(P)-dependent oxidoreductase [Sphaerochaeta sp.]|uniref:SDR family NAD(P)-dependent oxidoreductase n=1 Tax=Sphaerochaeta sp. TaxID=1972642 RepID=UPI0029707F12|nr:SDR family NAD(P)-dependent oxidoreductase [Sphaerochaeta sp.]MDD3928217.1 SDR family NAD(P)-dependent oxidoreductase [Sphaerochaeta sp.]